MSKIFFWKSGDDDACSFYRCAEPGRALRKLGHEVIVARLAGLADLMTSDVVVIQRPTEAAPRTAIEKLLSIPEHGRPRIVVELDDDLYTIPEHNPAKASAAQLHRLTEAMQLADRITVTNDHLAQRVREETERRGVGGQIRVVPNYVSERYVVREVPEPGHAPVITWAGTDTHRRDFDEVAVPLRKLLRERGDFQVRIVGAPYAWRLYSAAFKRGLPEVERTHARITQVPWIEGVARYLPTLTGHIGLAPLADDVFNRSKSDLRLKELAARGMAVLASAVGPYADSRVPRGLVGTASHVNLAGWYDVLTAFLGEPDGRALAAKRSLEWAQTNTLEAHATEWEKALLD